MKKLFIILVLLLITQPLWAITLPFSEDFDDNSYVTDLGVISRNGATHTHLASGGWSGGAARFTPPTTWNNNPNPGNGTYSGIGGLGFFTGGNEPTVHIRFLIRHSANWEENVNDSGYGVQDKMVIVTPVSGNRGMTIYEKCQSQDCAGQDYYTWGVCQDNGCTYEGDHTKWWPNGNDAFKSEDYEEKWVCLELMVSSSGTTQLYITTQDGVHSGLYDELTGKSFTDFRGVEGIGWYFNGYYNDSTTWFDIDELVISTSYIGPPDGFVTGESPPPGPPPSGDNTKLPFNSDFEEGNWSEWEGGRAANMSIISTNPHGGQYCARALLTQGTHSDNYLDFYFGDHVSYGGEKVEEIWLQAYSKFDVGYVWPNDSHKIALINITDGQTSERRYQVMIVVDREGRYFVEHSYIASWQFFGLAQNQGTPVAVRFGEWDKLNLYTKLNTPGNSDGVVKLWVNDELKISYDNVNIRQNTSYGMNKLIMSSYATDASGSNGVQYYDDWILSATDPLSAPEELSIIGSY